MYFLYIQVKHIFMNIYFAIIISRNESTTKTVEEC